MSDREVDRLVSIVSAMSLVSHGNAVEFLIDQAPWLIAEVNFYRCVGLTIETDRDGYRFVRDGKRRRYPKL